jgi:hypothetical protein
LQLAVNLLGQTLQAVQVFGHPHLLAAVVQSIDVNGAGTGLGFFNGGGGAVAAAVAAGAGLARTAAGCAAAGVCGLVLTLLYQASQVAPRTGLARHLNAAFDAMGKPKLLEQLGPQVPLTRLATGNGTPRRRCGVRCAAGQTAQSAQHLVLVTRAHVETLLAQEMGKAR